MCKYNQVFELVLNFESKRIKYQISTKFPNVGIVRNKWGYSSMMNKQYIITISVISN